MGSKSSKDMAQHQHLLRKQFGEIIQPVPLVSNCSREQSAEYKQIFKKKKTERSKNTYRHSSTGDSKGILATLR